MKLSQCTIGTLVRARKLFSEETSVGHIVGLDTNSFEEVVPIVQFAHPFTPHGEPRKPNPPRAIHHGNLEPLTD